MNAHSTVCFAHCNCQVSNGSRNASALKQGKPRLANIVEEDAPPLRSLSQQLGISQQKGSNNGADVDDDVAKTRGVFAMSPASSQSQQSSCSPMASQQAAIFRIPASAVEPPEQSQNQNLQELPASVPAPEVRTRHQALAANATQTQVVNSLWGTGSSGESPSLIVNTPPPSQSEFQSQLQPQSQSQLQPQPAVVRPPQTRQQFGTQVFSPLSQISSQVSFQLGQNSPSVSGSISSSVDSQTKGQGHVGTPSTVAAAVAGADSGSRTAGVGKATAAVVLSAAVGAGISRAKRRSTNDRERNDDKSGSNGSGGGGATRTIKGNGTGSARKRQRPEGKNHTHSGGINNSSTTNATELKKLRAREAYQAMVAMWEQQRQEELEGLDFETSQSGPENNSSRRREIPRTRRQVDTRFVHAYATCDNSKNQKKSNIAIVVVLC